MNNIDHPPPLPLGTSDGMSGDSRGLRDLIEASASAAQRGPLARLQDDYDDDDNERPVTVGDAIEGAATTTTDSARQAAALVSNQPSHNRGSNFESPGRSPFALLFRKVCGARNRFSARNGLSIDSAKRGEGKP